MSHIATLNKVTRMPTPQERRNALIQLLNERVLVLDGAMGTMIHQAPLSIETDYLGRENCPEILNVTRPDVIKDIHRQYLEAGADIVETNTFGGARLALLDNKLEDRAYDDDRQHDGHERGLQGDDEPDAGVWMCDTSHDSPGRHERNR